MHGLSIGIALLVGVAIIAIGARWLASPRAAAPSFGLPLPEEGKNIDWWLRLKGLRDIASGLVVLAFTVWGRSWDLGLVLLIYTLIPIGDMLTILAARGSTKHAFGIHGSTAALMMLAAILLTTGVPSRSGVSSRRFSARACSTRSARPRRKAASYAGGIPRGGAA